MFLKQTKNSVQISIYDEIVQKNTHIIAKNNARPMKNVKTRHKKISLSKWELFIPFFFFGDDNFTQYNFSFGTHSSKFLTSELTGNS